MWSPMGQWASAGFYPHRAQGFDISTGNWGNYTPRGLPIGNPNPRKVLEKATLARDEIGSEPISAISPFPQPRSGTRSAYRPCPYQLHTEPFMLSQAVVSAG